MALEFVDLVVEFLLQTATVLFSSIKLTLKIPHSPILLLIGIGQPLSRPIGLLLQRPLHFAERPTFLPIIALQHLYGLPCLPKLVAQLGDLIVGLLDSVLAAFDLHDEFLVFVDEEVDFGQEGLLKARALAALLLHLGLQSRDLLLV